MSRLPRAAALSILLLLSLLALPAAAQQAPDYVVVDPADGFTALDGATAFSGTLTLDGADSGYRIEVPDDWNGTLVLYAHGFVGPQQAELIVQDPPLRELFIGQGFAWAASSYSANGYVIDDPVDETDALRSQFADLTGMAAPTATIFHGISMGGHITGVAIERRPDAYVGALPACGVLADVELFDYFADVNLVAGALAGVDVPVPGDLSFLGGPAQQISATLGLQTGLTEPAGVQYADVVEALSGGERPTFEESFDFWNIAAAVDPGQGPTIPFLQALYGRALSMGIENPVVSDTYDNASTIYGFPNATSPEPSSEEQMLNDLVTRYSGTGTPPFPVIEGTPQIPVLSLHTTGDLFVPLFNERVYAEEVMANGLADNLVQRTVRAAGHCDFTGPELAGAFADLVGWITTGTAPAGEDLRNPTVVADRSLGCAWTSETRPGMPPCGGPEVTSLTAPDPVATAIRVSGTRDAATTVVLARSDDFADALTGSAFAGVADAPVLLNPMAALDATVLAEIQRLGATDVVILGGTAALSAAVEQSLVDAGLTVSRLAGPDRFGTASAVAEAVATNTGAPSEVYLASGRGFADAVGVAGLAAFLGRPILLTEPTFMPQATSDALAALGDPTVTVIGGSAAVDDAVAGDSGRLAGENRYGTSAAVVDASRNAGLRINELWIVSGGNFVEALVAGPASAAAGQVMVMVDGGDLAGSAGTTNDVVASLSGRVDGLSVVQLADSITQQSIDALLTSVSGPAQPDS